MLLLGDCRTKAVNIQHLKLNIQNLFHFLHINQLSVNPVMQ